MQIRHAPLALKLSAAKGKRDQRSVAQLFARNPWRKHAGPETDFDQLLDRLHRPEFDVVAQQDFFLTKIFAN